MRQIVVDTDVLILHLRGIEAARKAIKEAAADSLLYCSAITIGEIYAGMKEQARENTERLLDSLVVIDVSREIAALAGNYRRTIRSHQLELDDCLIAATCALRRAVLLTCNIKHYPMSDFEKKRVKIP